MDSPRIFIDSCVLILASKAQEDDISLRAIQELDREGVQYLYSPMIELETLPKPTVNGYADQVAFLRAFFDNAERVECPLEAQALALEQACNSPVALSALDALHVACAISANASELVTAEKPTAALPKAKGIEVRTIRID